MLALLSQHSELVDRELNVSNNSPFQICGRESLNLKQLRFFLTVSNFLLHWRFIWVFGRMPAFGSRWRCRVVLRSSFTDSAWWCMINICDSSEYVFLRCLSRIPSCCLLLFLPLSFSEYLRVFTGEYWLRILTSTFISSSWLGPR